MAAGGGEILRQCFWPCDLFEAHILAFEMEFAGTERHEAAYVLANNRVNAGPGAVIYFFEQSRGFVESGYAEFYHQSTGLTRDAYVETHDQAAVYSLNGTNVAYSESVVSAHGYNTTSCYDKATVIDYGDPVEVTLKSSEAKRLAPDGTELH